MRRRLLFASVLSVTIGVPVSGGAEVFRCTGSSGEPLFSQVPCGEDVTVVVGPRARQEPARGLRAAETAWLDQRARQRKSRSGRKQSVANASASRQSAAVRAHRCLRTRRDLETVNAKLRRGYKPSEGEKLRGRRQRYEDYLSSFCD